MLGTGKTLDGRDVPAARRRSRIGCFATTSTVGGRRHAHAALHRRHRRERHRRPDLRHGRRGRRLRQRRLGRPLSHRPRAARSCCATTATARSPTSRRRAAPANPGGWGVSASFVDYDRDGWLDLFVGNYLLYTIDADIDCLSVTGQHDYCPPNSYRAQPSRLYRNRGNGTFEDVTRTALVGGAYGPALGVSTADFDGDGWIDIYVGNDGAAEPALDQPEERHVQGHGVPVGRGGQRRRQRRSQHGHRRRRLRQRRRRGSVHHQLAGADEHPLRQRRHGRVRGSQGAPPASARPAWRRPASAPPGSTTTTTAGSTC